MDTQMTYTEGQAAAARLIKAVSEGDNRKATKEQIVAAVRALGYEQHGSKDALVALAYAKAIVVGQTHARESEARWQERSRAAFPAKVRERVADLRAKLQQWLGVLAHSANPMWELESCDSRMEQAAELEAWQNIEKQVNAGRTPAEIHAELVTRLMWLASTQRHNSTSITHNMAEEIRRLVLADIVQDNLFTHCGVKAPRRL